MPRGPASSLWATAAALLSLYQATSIASASAACAVPGGRCACEWGSAKSGVQCMGLDNEPSGTTASLCEKSCCEKNAKEPGSCETWQWAKEPSGSGCWQGKHDEPCAPPTEQLPWVGAEKCIGPVGGWGGPFLLVLFVCTVVYLVAGAAYQYKVKQVTRPSADLLIHKEHWLELAGLVTDGVRFCTAKLKGLTSQASTAAGSAAPPGYGSVATAGEETPFVMGQPDAEVGNHSDGDATNDDEAVVE